MDMRKKDCGGELLWTLPALQGCQLGGHSDQSKKDFHSSVTDCWNQLNLMVHFSWIPLNEASLVHHFYHLLPLFLHLHTVVYYTCCWKACISLHWRSNYITCTQWCETAGCTARGYLPVRSNTKRHTHTHTHSYTAFLGSLYKKTEIEMLLMTRLQLCSTDALHLFWI